MFWFLFKHKGIMYCFKECWYEEKRLIYLPPSCWCRCHTGFSFNHLRWWWLVEKFPRPPFCREGFLATRVCVSYESIVFPCGGTKFHSIFRGQGISSVPTSECQHMISCLLHVLEERTVWRTTKHALQSCAPRLLSLTATFFDMAGQIAFVWEDQVARGALNWGHIFSENLQNN